MEANYIDLPTILIYAFWIGFAGLIFYLRREDKRVGYPLESDRQGVSVEGWPAMPPPRPARAKHPALEGAAGHVTVVETTVIEAVVVESPSVHDHEEDVP